MTKTQRICPETGVEIEYFFEAYDINHAPVNGIRRRVQQTSDMTLGDWRIYFIQGRRMDVYIDGELHQDKIQRAQKKVLDFIGHEASQNNLNKFFPNGLPSLGILELIERQLHVHGAQAPPQGKNLV